MSTAVAFVMASELGIDWITFLWTVVGTMLSSAAAATWNQLFESKRDAKMSRTKDRPVPSGRISVLHAFVVGARIRSTGFAVIAVLVLVAQAPDVEGGHGRERGG